MYIFHYLWLLSSLLTKYACFWYVLLSMSFYMSLECRGRNLQHGTLERSNSKRPDWRDSIPAERLQCIALASLLQLKSLQFEGRGSDSRETPRSRISGEEDRCSGGGGGEGGVLNNFAQAGLILLLSVIWQPMQARFRPKHLANNENLWFYDRIVIKSGH